MTEEMNVVGGWWAAIKKAAPDSLTVLMRGKLRIRTRPQDKEALALLERYKDKTFGEVGKILDDAQFWLHIIQILSFEKEKEEQTATEKKSLQGESVILKE